MVKFRVKIINFLLQLIILAVFPVSISAQSTSEMKQIFAKAESYYLYEEYELANQLYLLLDTTANLILNIKSATAI